MRRFLLLAGSFALTIALLLSCSGDDGQDGLMGVPGSNGLPGAPQPIKVLLAGDDNQADIDTLEVVLYTRGFFPLGTTIRSWNLQDSIPLVSQLMEYDAVLVWFDGGSVNEPDSVGNTLADYVDAGGGVVIGEFYLSNNWQLQGRFMTDDGYSPLRSGPAGGTGPERRLDVTSMSFPLHPVFNGVDVRGMTYWENSNYSNPPLDPTATLLATDDLGKNAVAVSASGKSIGLNYWPVRQAQASFYHHQALKLVANSLLYVGGAFE